MLIEELHTDVVVVGAGNAALCAAITAREAGAEVLVLEKASLVERGGNSRFTGGLLRFEIASKDAVLALLDDVEPETAALLDVPPYTVDDYVEQVGLMSSSRADVALIRLLASRSAETVAWLRERGVRYELYEKYVEHEGRRTWPDRAMIKVLGGGEGLVAALFDTADALGVDVHYDAQVTALDFDSVPGRVVLSVGHGERARRVVASAAVLGSGGFEASPEARAKYLGRSWDLAKVRGTRHNTGEVLAGLIAMGAKPAGHWSDAHAVPVDAYSADVGDLGVGALTTRLSYPYGIMVNLDGKRFVDEGADFKLLTYARFGREILAQPQGRVFQIFDQRSLEMIEPRYRLGSKPVIADTIDDLADGLGVNRSALVSTVDGFNAAVGKGTFNPSILDGLATTGLAVEKSNWALRIDAPPYVAYAVTCGITFTYGGVGIDSEARVLSSSGIPIPRVFATGEITGGFFYHNYPAGAGLMRGAVYGRIAGENAAALAKAN